VRLRCRAGLILSRWTTGRRTVVAVAAVSVAVGSVAYVGPGAPWFLKVVLQPAVRREAFLVATGGQVSYGLSGLDQQAWQDRECGPDPQPGVTTLTLTYYRGVTETFTGRWATVCRAPSWDAASSQFGDPVEAATAGIIACMLLGGSILITRRLVRA